MLLKPLEIESKTTLRHIYIYTYIYMCVKAYDDKTCIHAWFCKYAYTHILYIYIYTVLSHMYLHSYTLMEINVKTHMHMVLETISVDAFAFHSSQGTMKESIFLRGSS